MKKYFLASLMLIAFTAQTADWPKEQRNNATSLQNELLAKDPTWQFPISFTGAELLPLLTRKESIEIEHKNQKLYLSPTTKMIDLAALVKYFSDDKNKKHNVFLTSINPGDAATELTYSLFKLVNKQKKQLAVFKLVVPTATGYLCYNDLVLEQRFKFIEMIYDQKGFTSLKAPQQKQFRQCMEEIASSDNVDPLDKTLAQIQLLLIRSATSNANISSEIIDIIGNNKGRHPILGAARLVEGNRYFYLQDYSEAKAYLSPLKLAPYPKKIRKMATAKLDKIEELYVKEQN